MERKTISMLLKVLLVTAVIFSISATAAATPSICRELPSGTQTAGSTISVDLVLSLDGAGSYLMDDTVPVGWEIISAPGSAKVSSDKRTVNYAKLGDGTDTTLTYTVKIPVGTSAGTYSFSGNYGIGENPAMIPIGCTDLSVIVDGTAGVAEVCRNLPSGEQSAGSTISVDLVVLLDGAGSYLMDDTVPAGWEIISAPGSAKVSSDKRTVNYAKLGDGTDTTLTYTVKIPAGTSAGTYPFSGHYGIGENPDMISISCTDLSVTVGEGPAPQPSDASVCRNLPSGAQSAGSTISVDLVVLLDGAGSYLMDDTVPAGWEISSAPGSAKISSDKRTVSYAKLGDGTDATLTYTVKIPAGTSAGTYPFSGQYGIGENPDMISISCTDLSVTVGEPITGIHLQNGWNLFSVPCVLDDDSRAHVLEGVDYEAIIWFDASSQQWEDNPATIEPLTAYAIHVNNTTQQVITNIIECTDLPIVPPSRHMYPGWNLVGLTSYDTKTAESAFIAGGIDDSYSVVWGPWDPVDGLEKLVYNRNMCDPGAGYLYTDDYIMWPYKGQWIFMDQEDTLRAIGPEP